MELNLTHVSIALSLSTLLVVLKVAYRIGRFMNQFEQMQLRVRLHDKLLGIPVLDGSKLDPLDT